MREPSFPDLTLGQVFFFVRNFKTETSFVEKKLIKVGSVERYFSALTVTDLGYPDLGPKYGPSVYFEICTKLPVAYKYR
jgi:hypothetical protein